MFDISRFAPAAQPPASERRNIEAITREILQLKNDAGNAILGIGQRLLEAKAMLPRGEWLPWLTEQVEFSERQAQRFMKLAQEWANPTALSDLGATDDEPLLLGPYDTYRRTAKYWNKEASDGITVPVGARTWVASRSLNAKLPPLEMWRSTSGEIESPQNVRVQGGNQTANEFGVYLYKWWISNSAFILNK